MQHGLSPFELLLAIGIIGLIYWGLFSQPGKKD